MSFGHGWSNVVGCWGLRTGSRSAAASLKLVGWGDAQAPQEVGLKGTVWKSQGSLSPAAGCRQLRGRRTKNWTWQESRDTQRIYALKVSSVLLHFWRQLPKEELLVQPIFLASTNRPLQLLPKPGVTEALLLQVSIFCTGKGNGRTRGRGNTLLQCIFGLMLSLQHFADSLGSSLGPADALMPLLPCHTHVQSPRPVSWRPIYDSGHSRIKRFLSRWLYPSDNRLALTDKWLELNCHAKCKYALAEMEN